MENLAFPHKTLLCDTFVFISYRKVGNIQFDKTFVLFLNFLKFKNICPQVRVVVRGAGLEDGDGVLQPAAGRGAAAVRVEGRGRHLAARALRPPRRHRAQGCRRDISGENIYFEVELGK